MKYPRIANWLVRNKRPDGLYEIRDCLCEDVYTMSGEVLAFTRNRDGKHDPYTVMPEQKHVAGDPVRPAARGRENVFMYTLTAVSLSRRIWCCS